MANQEKPLLIKRYASRRLYNTETSDYVTLEEIARIIREGREVKIVDLKTGDDLTRPYLLQIITEHEAKGENVLPVQVLTDIVRSYTDHAQSFMPDFLSASFKMLRDNQTKMVERLQAGLGAPMAAMQGFEEIQKKQRQMLGAFMGGWMNPVANSDENRPASDDTARDLEDIKRQLADLQEKLARM